MTYSAKPMGKLPTIQHANGVEYRVHALEYINGQLQWLQCHTIEDGECINRHVSPEFVVNLDELLAAIKEDQP